MNPRLEGGSFCGKEIHPSMVDGLTAELRTGKRQSIPIEYIVFRDSRGIKWKIIPTINVDCKHPGTVRWIGLYHRNAHGRKGFHSQHARAFGNKKGVEELLKAIREHEQYEKTKEG